MEYIIEPEKKIPIIESTDLCVVGGSCTGVFAAVRAARIGMKVVLIEQQNMLGGMAVTGLVNIWHSLHDTEGKKQIIAGLTQEVIERLKKRNAVTCSDDPNIAFNFNPWELTIILDELIRENKIIIMLHTSYAGIHYQDNEIRAVLVENVDGRSAVEAKFFIDATGDGRLARDLKIPCYVNEGIQPPTSCFHLQGNMSGINVGELERRYGKEFGLSDDWGWSKLVSGCQGITMRADNHVYNVRCDRARDLTFAEMEGRRQADAFKAMISKYGGRKEDYSITSLCSHIGVRETVHYETRYQAKAKELLIGKRYEAPVLNGSYRIDIHHSEGNGITFQYLDGLELIAYGQKGHYVEGNWREREGLSGPAATYYQLPFEVLVGKEYKNFIAVGRMLNADKGAFGALRVMVNLNQLGEAAGVAAWVCINSNKEVYSIDGRKVTEKLREGGSIV